MMKSDSSNMMVWAKTYNKYGDDYSFEVDSQEAYIYHSTAGTNFFLHKLSANDGEVVSSKIIYVVLANVPDTALKLFGSTSSLFFSGKSSSNRAGFCHTDVATMVSADCIAYLGFNQSPFILPVSSTDLLFITNESTSPNPINIRM